MMTARAFVPGVVETFEYGRGCEYLVEHGGSQDKQRTAVGMYEWRYWASQLLEDGRACYTSIQQELCFVVFLLRPRRRWPLPSKKWSSVN